MLILVHRLALFDVKFPILLIKFLKIKQMRIWRSASDGNLFGTMLVNEQLIKLDIRCIVDIEEHVDFASSSSPGLPATLVPYP